MKKPLSGKSVWHKLANGTEFDALPSVTGLATFAIVFFGFSYGPLAAFVINNPGGYGPVLLLTPFLAAISLLFAWLRHKPLTTLQKVNVFWFLAPLVCLGLLYVWASGITTPAL